MLAKRKSNPRAISTPFRGMRAADSGPIVKPQWPLVFDLIDDPVEEWDLIEKRLDCAWVFAPVARCLGALAQSAARYPHVKPGEELTGYA